MTNEEYQEWSNSTACYPQSWRWYNDQSDCERLFPSYLLLGLNGECGEVTEIFKKYNRRVNNVQVKETELNQEEKDKVKLELGDVLWYFPQICTELGITLSEVMEANKHKLEERYNGR